VSARNIMNHHDLHSVRRFAEAYTAAWCSQNPNQVAACYSEHGSLSVNNDPPAVGREAIADVARGFMTAFPDMKVSLDDIRWDKSNPTYHWTLIGTNSGPGGTGRSVHINGYEVWEIGADGLIANSEGHFDSAEYRRQLGS